MHLLLHVEEELDHRHFAVYPINLLQWNLPSLCWEDWQRTLVFVQKENQVSNLWPEHPIFSTTCDCCLEMGFLHRRKRAYNNPSRRHSICVFHIPNISLPLSFTVTKSGAQTCDGYANSSTWLELELAISIKFFCFCFLSTLVWSGIYLY